MQRALATSALNMRHLPSSRQVLGTPFWLIAMPMCFAGWLTNRNKGRVLPCTPHGLAAHEWTRMEWCFVCKRETEHLFLQFPVEPAVDAECRECRTVTSDRGDA